MSKFVLILAEGEDLQDEASKTTLGEGESIFDALKRLVCTDEQGSARYDIICDMRDDVEHVAYSDEGLQAVADELAKNGVRWGEDGALTVLYRKEE